jgi:Zn-finger nucleic acid-binding protein
MNEWHISLKQPLCEHHGDKKIPPMNVQILKFWEIDCCYKCAIIGTCLNRTELRKLAKDKIYAAPPRLDDYCNQRFENQPKSTDKNLPL